MIGREWQIVRSNRIEFLLEYSMGEEMKKQEGEQVELTIRCALQSFDDTTISCALDSTVLELKALIHATCASRPVRALPVREMR